MKGIIRPLKLDEYDQCSSFREMANPPQSEDFFADFKSGNRIIYVYEINGVFVGEGALVFENGDPDYTIAGVRIYMSRVIVGEKNRNLGIGAKIVDHLFDVAS